MRNVLCARNWQALKGFDRQRDLAGEQLVHPYLHDHSLWSRISCPAMRQARQ